MPVRFDEPWWLLMLLLLVPTFWLSFRSLGAISRGKVWTTFTLRAIVIAGLAIALADPYWVKKGEGLTVTVLLDRSQSVPVPLKRESLEFMRLLAEGKERIEDRVAVITIAKDSVISSLPDAYSAVDVGAEPAELTATNLASGVRLAMAIMPDDTANRIVIASDGNETMDSVLAAAELARANGVPVDVVTLEYDHRNEVIFEQIIAPPRSRVGQTARLRMMLRSQAPASGEIRLEMNGIDLDLNGEAEGEGLRVVLEPGTTVRETVISLDNSGPHEFEAVFVPDEPAMDEISRNNSAVAVTFVGSEGKVLIIDDGFTYSRYLVEALAESGIDVDVRSPGEWDGGLIQISAYDAVVLANVPIYAFAREQDRMLHSYVHDFGGGLVMLGGEQSFGAGGWIDSETAKTLPVELNPPQTREMPAGALALIMHSCEMAQGNYWGQQVATAAINALSRLDYVGIIEFNWGAAGGIQGCTWAYPMQQLGDKQGAIQATKTMTIGDMPAFAPSMELALQGLTSVPAAQRHAIVISDGDPSPPGAALIAKYNQAQATITTVMVGGHGTGADRNKMQQVAQQTGGRFYNPTNPKQLPQIFFKEATLVSRSLIQEGDRWSPAVTTGLPGPAMGFPEVPTIDGYVLTAVREGLAQTPIVIPTSEANDPLFANWNYGLGRSIAFTSDVSGRWGAQWASWDRFRAFWEQSIRWVMRPSTPTNVNVNTRLEGDLAVVEVEALEADASYLNFLRTSAAVVGPDSEAEPLPLQQVGPGRYRGQFRTDDAGAYLINILHESGAGDAKVSGSVQAAVSVPYPREFRAVKHNGALLSELARTTGGREIDPAMAPELINLFDPGDLEVPRSPRPIWDILAIVAASLLLLDVAARRVSIEPSRIRAAVGRAMGRRGEVKEDTVAAWKRARSKVDERTRVEPAAREVRSVRFEADEESSAQAIDVGAEKPTERADGPAPVRRIAEPEAADDDDGDYTSRLLAAKRRARGGDESEGDSRGS